MLLGNLLENGHSMCKNNIKLDSTELGCEESRRMEMAQGRFEMQALKLAMLDLVCFMLRQYQVF
jgi:hypothetical protein